jgi:hypothetical protein
MGKRKEERGKREEGGKIRRIENRKEPPAHRAYGPEGKEERENRIAQIITL